MRALAKIKEPLLGYEQKFLVVPLDKMEVIEIQRKPSPHHIRRLQESMRKIGFVVPLIAIEKEKGEKYVVIDGQHRYLAAKEMGIDALPIIVVPEKYAYDLMELNIEKQMSLREKAYVALNVYRQYLEDNPELSEDDGAIKDSIEFPHYITFGLAYEENSSLWGSALESIARRTDNFLVLPLKEAVEVRKEQAKLLVESDRLARQASEKIKELGIDHPFLAREIISFCSPIGRKRIIEESFEEVFEKLNSNLKALIKHPEKFREHKFEAVEEGAEAVGS